MSNFIRFLILSVLSYVMFYWGLLKIQDRIPNINIKPDNEVSCENVSDRFRLIPVDDESRLAVSINGDSVGMMGNSTIEGIACNSGWLVLNLSPQATKSGFPRIVISSNSVRLFDDYIYNNRTIRLKVAKTSVVRISYVNDEYISKYREAVISEISFHSNECKEGFEITSNSADRQKEHDTISLIYPDPTIIRPCGAGDLNFLVSGNYIKDQFPSVMINNGTNKYKIIAGRSAARHKFSIGRNSVFEISILNPYIEFFEDRNLIIRKYWFVSDSKSK